MPAARPSRPQDTIGRGFDFTRHIRALAGDISSRVPRLQHINLERVSVAFSQTRKRVMYGMQASLTPLRFEQGARVGIVRGRRVKVQQLYDARGVEMLYILTFYLPRFLDLEFREKLSTIVHELWHISPQFDGDLRRHEGRCYAHGHSQAAYDAQVEELLAEYLAGNPPPHLQAFLHFDFNELQLRHARVFGSRIPRPRLLSAD